MRNWSAIYSAPGGANGSEPNERLQWFGLNRCNGSVQQSQLLAVQLTRSGSVGRAVRIAERVCSQPIPVRPDSKRTRPGREPEPRPRPGPEPEPGTGAAAAASGDARAHERAWYPPNRARKLQVPKGHALCSHFSLFKHYKLPSYGQCGTKCL